MKLNNKSHIIVILLVLLIILFPKNTILGSEIFEAETTGNLSDLKTENTQQSNSGEPITLSLEDAILYALANNLDIEEAFLTLDEMEIQYQKARSASRKLRNSKDQIKEGYAELNARKQQLNQINATIEQLETDSGNPDTIQDLFQAKEQLTQGISKAEQDLSEAQQSIYANVTSIREGISNADSAADLIEAKSKVGLDIANAALLVQKRTIELQVIDAYYSILEKQRMVKIQESSLELAEQIQDFAFDSYDVGFSPKDEALLAQLNVSSAQVNLLEAKHELEKANTKLKKLFNMDLSQNINLVDTFTQEKFDNYFYEDLSHGLENRIEILIADGELAIAELEYDLVSRAYPPITYYYQEAKTEMDQKYNQLQKQKVNVAASIYDSYDAVLTSFDILETVKDMQLTAEENLNIATYRYKIGFGDSSKMLQQMNNEGLSGTIVEVLAAQEMLAEVKTSYIKCLHNYNLAFAKYNFDIGAY